MNEQEYKYIMAWIDRNSYPNGFVTEIGLRKLIKKLRRETLNRFTNRDKR